MDSVAPPPDAVAEAFIDCLQLLADTAELGWVRRAGAVTSVLTRVPVVTLNGVWATAAARPEEIDARLDEVAAHGLPYCIQARPQCHAAAAAEPPSRRRSPPPSATRSVSSTSPPPPSIAAAATARPHLAGDQRRPRGRCHLELASVHEPASRVYERLGFATLERWSCWLGG